MNQPSSLDRIRLVRLAEDHYDPTLAKICPEQIRSISWPGGSVEPMIMQLPEPLANNQIEAVCFLLAMTAINYRFWNQLPDRSVGRYKHLGTSGARALWAAFEGAWGVQPNPGTELAGRLNAGEFTSIFGNIQDREGRMAILTEVLSPGKLAALAESMIAEIRTNRRVTVSQAANLAQQFPLAFDDPYLKKAQLATSMIAAYLRSFDIEVDTADLTAFADYQVPRVMRALGVIEYGVSLADKVDQHIPIQEGGREEQAIRAATILGCEAIAEHTGRTSADIDNLLWLAQDLAGEAPFHLTETRRY